MSFAAHAAAFDRDGYTVVRGALEDVTVARLRDQLTRCAEAALVHGGASQAGQGGGPVWQVIEAHHHVPGVLDALRTVRIAAVAAACLGARRMQLLQDVLLVKPAR